MKPSAFLTAARTRWRALTGSSPDRHQAGEEALALVTEAYAQTPAYNYQLQLDELRARIRHLESDLVAERTATLRLGRQLDQQPGPTPKRQLRAQAEEARTTELARLRRWLAASEQEGNFFQQRLHKLQTELRRRITHLERTRPA